MSVFMPIPYYFNYYSFVIEFEIREDNASSFVLLRIALTIQGPLWCHTNFRNTRSISVKNAIGILIEIALNL